MNYQYNLGNGQVGQTGQIPGNGNGNINSNNNNLVRNPNAQMHHGNPHNMLMIPQPTLMAPNTILTVGPYKHRKDLTRESVVSKYQILGYIAAGTYGKVYKAKSKRAPEPEEDQQISTKSTQSSKSFQYNYQALYNPLVRNQGNDKSNSKNGNGSTSNNNSNNNNSNMNSMGNNLNSNNMNYSSGNPAGPALHLNNQFSKNYSALSTGGNTNISINNNNNNNNNSNDINNNGNTNNNGIVSNNNNNTNINISGINSNSKINSTTANGTNTSGPSSSDGGNTLGEPELLYAIKKFKNDNHLSNKNYSHDINGNEIIHYTGISQSAMREMSICREISNKNITKTIDILLENKSIYIVLEFCEHDLLQIIHYHSHPEVRPIPERTIKSLIWQILNGVLFLHKNWIFHRDLKPANIMVTSNGVVKIGDLGLARKFNNPLQSLYTGDKVVVTIWYRAPELLLGTRNYTPAIDLWAVGCILAELLSLRPIFKGEEAKIDINNKKLVPFQTNQFQKIVEIIGSPTVEAWPSLQKFPEYSSFKQQLPNHYNSNLNNWYKAVGGNNKNCLSLLKGLLEYDPIERLTAENALIHPFFLEQPILSENAFDGLPFKYPKRRIYTDDNDIISGVLASKRHVFDDSKGRKRQR